MLILLLLGALFGARDPDGNWPASAERTYVIGPCVPLRRVRFNTTDVLWVLHRCRGGEILLVPEAP